VVEKAVFMSQARVPLQSNTYTGSVKRKDNRLVSDVCKSPSVGSEDCRPHDDQEYSSIRPLIDWLGFNGFTVVTKPLKEFTDASGRRMVKGNMDIELAVQAIQLAPSLDHIVLFSGDGDFRSLVADLQQRGKRVSVISTLQSSPPMIADELRRQADQFIELADLEPIICREPSARNTRAPNGHGRTAREGTGNRNRDLRRRPRRRALRGCSRRGPALRDEIPGDVDLLHAALAYAPV
jgi:uncharacterized LabA/DUF88 family protein